ncbi:site-specific integrase [Paenibacillus albus]|uniref:Site-specific integrase n=1 Tax=Paenibacillus albus TaxID=2495582 RepID=A0A3S9A3Z1_9BACL|nr:site-specific integrase [Paenibacillus albus]AZN40447.1 site-specific integrase [Paenibacillus albus]
MASFQQYDTKKEGKMWLYKLVTGTDANGKQKHTTRRGFATKKEAQKHAAAFQTDLARGLAVAEVRKDTLAEFCTECLEKTFKHNLKSGTLLRQRGFLKYIVEHIGGMKVQKITPKDINNFYNDLLEGDEEKGRAPLGAGTVRGVGMFLSKCMKQAVDFEMRPSNPCDKVKKPSYKPKPRAIWSAEQFLHFLESSKDSRLHPLYMIALLTGLRFGEVTSLTWDDVNFDEQTITVSKTTARTENTIFLQEETKTGKNRAVTMSETLARYLKRYKLKQKPNPLGLVVATERGKIMHNASARNTFVRDVEAAGLPLIVMHAMRHSHLTDLLLSGEAVAVVSQRAGHSSPSITMGVYAHALPSSQRTLADKMEERYKLNL